ncbi:hypothetical protein R3P38DRAFT_3120393 [Favolaschia claudopus]|uniref:F-box domain-containing protein n=1 Tax=Favolaschia claudopus TaxID=2862362 RepID=A0AAV9ZDW1_9AGAR
MHRCWNVPEILGLIFENFSAETPSGSRALSQLAVTCLDFSEPALDALWRKQTSFVPLLRCLGETWHGVEEDVPLTRFVVAGIVLPEDWDRVLFYTNRIKFLDIAPVDDNGLSLEVLELLSTSVPVKYLMPNLQHRSWVPYLRLFLGPKLTSIEISLNGKPSRMALLPFIAHRYRNTLLNLKIEQRNDEGEYVIGDPVLATMNAIVRSLRAIQTLHLDCCDDECIPPLARLPDLRSLTVDYVSFDNRWRKSRGGFQALKVLRLYEMSSLSEAEIFLERLVDAPLVELALSAASYNAEILLATLSSIESHCAHASLSRCSLYLTNYQNGPVLATPDPFPCETLSPLLSFPNLTFVRIESCSGFNLDDAFMHRMAESWPKITHLTLTRSLTQTQSNASSAALTTPTILSLQSFAQNCPRLTHLSLSELNASIDLPPAPTRASSTSHPRPVRPMQSALMVLDVGNAPVGLPLATARFLCSMFASLGQITTAESVSNDHRLGWEKVIELLPTIHAIRAEEEAYWISTVYTLHEILTGSASGVSGFRLTNYCDDAMRTNEVVVRENS